MRSIAKSMHGYILIFGYNSNMSAYIILKYIHVITAIISIAGFIVRGIWMMLSSTMLQQRWVKIAPHINDTLLLASAIALVFITLQYPGPAAWVNAKIIALVVYIALGMVALKPSRPMGVRIAAWCLAILTFAYIVLVALSKNVMPVI